MIQQKQQQQIAMLALLNLLMVVVYRHLQSQQKVIVCRDHVFAIAQYVMLRFTVKVKVNTIMIVYEQLTINPNQLLCLHVE